MAEPEEEGAQAPADEASDKPFACPDCGRSFDEEWKLKLHRTNAKHGGADKASSAQRSREPSRGAARASEAAIQKVVDEAVGNLIVIGGYLSIVLPHTGLAIAGVPDGRGGFVVQSRAIMAGGILSDYAQRDERVLRALERFNGALRGSAASTLAVSLAAAIAVDVGIVDPHMAIEVGPFQGEQAIRPVELVLGDVIAEVDRLRDQAEQGPAGPEPAPAAANGRRKKERAPDGAAVISGGEQAT